MAVIHAYECRKCGYYREVRVPPSTAVAALIRQQTPTCTNPNTRCNTALRRVWHPPNLSSKAVPTRRKGKA